MITLIERKCKDCGIKLTEYEAENKQGFCMECSKDNQPPIKEEKVFSLKNYKNK